MTGLQSPVSLFPSDRFHQRNDSAAMSIGTSPGPAENKPTSSNGASIASNPPAGQAEGSGSDVSKPVQEVLSSEVSGTASDGA
ncbi:hypothetical protein IMZ48_25380 [Candidatus Bathyarchaeota archaeon]|nr:hypothetical protein [Candidatus Bathyarchaeota archaeon]